jgi:acetyl esterase/lipase
MTIRLAACAAAAAVAILPAATVVRAQDVAPLSAYGALPGIEMVEISPSGDRLAYVTVIGEQRAMLITDLESGATLGGARVGENKVRDLKWVGEDHILATMSHTTSLPRLGLGKTEFLSGQIYSLTDRRIIQVFDGVPGVMQVMADMPRVRRIDGEPAILVRGFAPEEPEAVNLYRLNPTTGRGPVAIDMSQHARTVVLDASGRPLARADYHEMRRRWSLHLARSQTAFRDVWSLDAPVDTPRLLGMGRRDRTVLIDVARNQLPAAVAAAENAATTGGGMILYEIDVDTGEWTRLPRGEDADLLVHHPLTGLLIGTGRTTERCVQYEFPDEADARAWAAAARPFLDRCPRPISWSDDLGQIVIFTEGPGDPGVYHLVDLEKRTAAVVGDRYPTLTAGQVGEVRPIQYAAADGLSIAGYLTLPPGAVSPSGLPLVVLAHGGPAARDAYGFDWWAQALASRGYAVLQANFRGSTGHGQPFMEAGYGEWGRKMQTDLSDGVRRLAAEGLIDPERVCIVGASYGGYAALAGVTVEQDIYRCAVSVAGVSDLRRMVSWEASQGARRDNRTVRYWNRFMGAERTGDQGLDALSPARLADGADAPVLLLHGRDDTVVPIEQSRIMARALRGAGKPVEFIELDGEDHWLSRGDTRERMLTETVRFLEMHNPAR